VQACAGRRACEAGAVVERDAAVDERALVLVRVVGKRGPADQRALQHVRVGAGRVKGAHVARHLRAARPRCMRVDPAAPTPNPILAAGATSFRGFLVACAQSPHSHARLCSQSLPCAARGH